MGGNCGSLFLKGAVSVSVRPPACAWQREGGVVATLAVRPVPSTTYMPRLPLLALTVVSIEFHAALPDILAALRSTGGILKRSRGAQNVDAHLNCTPSVAVVLGLSCRPQKQTIAEMHSEVWLCSWNDDNITCLATDDVDDHDTFINDHKIVAKYSKQITVPILPTTQNSVPTLPTTKKKSRRPPAQREGLFNSKRKARSRGVVGTRSCDLGCCFPGTLQKTWVSVRAQS